MWKWLKNYKIKKYCIKECKSIAVQVDMFSYQYGPHSEQAKGTYLEQRLGLVKAMMSKFNFTRKDANIFVDKYLKIEIENFKGIFNKARENANKQP